MFSYLVWAQLIFFCFFFNSTFKTPKKNFHFIYTVQLFVHWLLGKRLSTPRCSLHKVYFSTARYVFCWELQYWNCCESSTAVERHFTTENLTNAYDYTEYDLKENISIQNFLNWMAIMRKCWVCAGILQNENKNNIFYREGGLVGEHFHTYSL